MDKMTIKAFRINAGLNQKDVAKALNVTTATIGRWEQGRTSPSFAKLIQLAELYKCDVGDFSMPDVHA